MDDATPRHLKEKTQKHYCVKCLKEIEREEYLRNDFVCDGCLDKEDFPLQSTPGNDER